VTLLRRPGNHSRRNRLYKALRELGRVVRTMTLLRYLSGPALREHVTAVTNRTGSFHNYATWLMIGGRLIGHDDPDYQEKVVKFNELAANGQPTPFRYGVPGQDVIEDLRRDVDFVDQEPIGGGRWEAWMYAPAIEQP
jgi:hypothetical protein